MASTTTFWNFIKNNTVEIPIIQRDYAQGRTGKENLRKVFLNNIKQALDRNLPNGETVLKLDFVYGSNENNILKPLDGQQRLTTLWLLHWYIALRANKLEEASLALRNFTYETRISSREFCHSLCDSKNFKDYDSENVVDFITSRTWFYAAWKQDPTIQAMLRMLGGTKINNNNGEDIIDGIEEMFACPQDCGIIKGQQCIINRTFNEYWNKLTCDNCPIIFYHLPLKDFGLSDDLYIKMNARGKQLTAFENFKAELVGFIRDKELEDSSWAQLSDAQSGIPISLDTNWTDLFWKHRSKGVWVKDRQGNSILIKTNQIDEIFLAFMNRLFWNELFMAKDTDKYLLLIGEGHLPDGTTSYSIETENNSYKYLNEDRCDLYVGLEPYKYYKKDIPRVFFDNMKLILDRFIKYNQELPLCKWDDKGFKFIPEYEKDENGYNIEAENASKETYLKVTTLNQVERIVFFAICKYFKQGEGEENSLGQWMRVVWNLVSGIGEDGRPQIRSTNAMRTAMEFLNMLDSHSVYESLITDAVVKNVEKEKASDFKSRCLEEIEKARQILNTKDDCDWETLIIEAENYAFFKGSIRFLYTSEDGSANWDDFNMKWANAQKYFKKDYKSKESAMNPEYRSASLLKALISRFTTENFWNTLWWKHRTFNNRQESWLYYLLKEEICAPVHELMCGNTDVKELSSSSIFEENALYYLSNTKLLDFVREKISYSWIRDYHGHKAIFPSGPGFFLDSYDRNHLLLYTPEITLYKENIVPETDLLFGLDINFKYSNKNFQWYRSDYVYLMEDNNPNEYILKNNEAKEEEEKYICFNAKKITDSTVFLAKLDGLINSFQPCPKTKSTNTSGS